MDRFVVAVMLLVGACGFELRPGSSVPGDGHDAGDGAIDGAIDAGPPDAATGFTGGRRTYVKASNTGADDRFAHAIASSPPVWRRR